MPDGKAPSTDIVITQPSLEIKATWPPTQEVLAEVRRAATAAVGAALWTAFPAGHPRVLALSSAGSPGEPGYILKIYQQLLVARRERWCFATLAGEVAHVPRLCASGAVDGIEWAVVEERPGVAAATLWDGLSPVARADLARQIGGTLRQIHDATATDRHGELELSWGRNYLTWSALLTNVLDRCRVRLAMLNSARDEVVVAQRALEGLYRQLRIFHPRYQAHLVTRNLQLSNILVTHDRGVVEFSGIIDFSGTVLAPGELDFGLLLWCDAIAGSEPIVSAFYEGYGVARTMDVRRREAIYRKIAALRVVDQSLMPRRRDLPMSAWERQTLTRSLRWLDVP